MTLSSNTFAFWVYIAKNRVGIASKSLKKFSVIEIGWFMQDSIGVNPDWLLFINLKKKKNTKVLLKISFWKILEKISRN